MRKKITMLMASMLLCMGAWAQVEEGKSYVLKVSGLDNAYIDTKTNRGGNQGGTIGISNEPVLTYFKASGDKWIISTDAEATKCLKINKWDVTPEQAEGSEWSIELTSEEDVYYLNQAVYTSGSGTYLGNSSLAVGSTLYSDQAVGTAVKVQFVETTEADLAKNKLTSLVSEISAGLGRIALQVENSNAAGYLSSCGSEDGNVEANMIDGSNSTFYGSPWLASVSGIDYHYWQVDLGDGVSLSSFVFSYVTRANGEDTPYSLVVKGSADGASFTQMEAISEGLPQSGGASYTSSVISNSSNYRYIRFEVTDTRKASGANPGYAAGGHATQKTIAIAEFSMVNKDESAWSDEEKAVKALVDAAQTVLDDEEATLDEVNEAYKNLKMTTVEKPEYPFTVTTDDANPVVYAIKSGRGDAYWYTYDAEDGKIALSQYTGADEQLWFFKEVVTDDYQYALQLYPVADEAKAMSYQNTSNDPDKIVSQVPGTEGWTNLWLLATTDGEAPYGLQTYDKANYLSNNGGTANKMGMWNAAPASDGGTAMYFSTPAEALQALIDEAEEMAKGEGTAVGYYTAASVASLNEAIATAKTNLENKNYSVTSLNEAIAALEVVLPEAGKYYQIHSGLQAFAETKAIYSTGSALAWKSLDGSDKTFYWTITPNAEGTSYTFQNVGDNGYLNGLEISETEVANTTTLKFLAPGEFNIVSNSKTLHAENHGSGSGTSGNIISYGGGANGASSWKIVEVEHPDLAVAKAALQNKVDELEAKVAASGTNPGYYDADETAQLSAPIATAQAVLEGGSSQSETYTEALTVLNEAIASLNLDPIPVTAGKYFIVNAKTAFADSKVLTTYGVCGWSRTASTPAWTEKNANDPLQYFEIVVSGETYSLKSAYEGSYITSVSTLGDEPVEATFTWLAPGQYNIIIADGVLHANLHGYGVNSSNIVSYAGSANDASAWKLVAVTEEPTFTHNLTVGETGYATLMLGFNATIPAGVTCNTIVYDGEYADLYPVEGNVLPANTPVIVAAEAGTYTFTSTKETAVVEKNELEGSLYPKNITPDANTTCYVLANGTQGVGLYKAALNKAENNAFLNNANKVYFPVTVEESEAPAMLRFGRGGDDTEDTTEIESTVNGQQTTVIYDLAGRRVEKMEKGIYIVNGRKVVVK